MSDKNKLRNAAAGIFFNDNPPQQEPQPVAEKPADTKPAEMADTGVQPLPANGVVVKLEAGYYRLPDPTKREAKTKHVQVLLQPSLYEEAKKEAKRRKTSFNELLHIALRKLLEDKE